MTKIKKPTVHKQTIKTIVCIQSKIKIGFKIQAY